MNILSLSDSWPIPTNPTWDVQDPTKINCYLDCPRQYLFQYVFGWRTTAPSNHLVFGDAMHRAHEHLLRHGYANSTVMEAFNERFLPAYREVFPADTDELFGSKTPASAFASLGLYVQEYRDDFRKYKVLYTETSGSVPVAADRVLHFRCDSILEELDSRQQIISLEHKTGSGITRFWTDQWELDIQPNLYNHVLYCLYGADRVKGVTINGLHFKKVKDPTKVCVFLRVPVWKEPSQMKMFLSLLNTILDRLENDYRLLSAQDDSHDILLAFPQNPRSCTKYFGCGYHPFCSTWNNPLRKISNIPMGFQIDFWDPRDYETEKKINLSFGEEVKPNGK